MKGKNIFMKKKRKKGKYYRDQNKNLFEKRKKVEYLINYYLAHKK